jgi:hypothetical protein
VNAKLSMCGRPHKMPRHNLDCFRFVLLVLTEFA